MSKILAVFGATGQQGGSVVNHVLNDSELAQQYQIRAITRNVESEKAKSLKEKVEVVQGDASDRKSLEAALAGVHTVFAMTTPSFSPDGFEIEYNQAKDIADVAVANGVQYLIFSTLPSPSAISGGKYTKVSPFEAKAKGERYIRSLSIKSAFFSPGSFMDNFANMPFVAPQPAGDGTWFMSRHSPPKAKMPWIYTAGDTGKFIGAILAEPDKYEGKTFCAATKLYDLDEIAAACTKATGKKVVYKQVSEEEYRDRIPFTADVLIEGFSYQDEFGYYGPDTEQLVAWAAENARGKPTTIEEYLAQNPLKLE